MRIVRVIQKDPTLGTLMFIGEDSETGEAVRFSTAEIPAAELAELLSVGESPQVEVPDDQIVEVI